jgi:hypothetical protein
MRLSTINFGIALAALGLLSPALADAQSIPSPFDYIERGSEVGVFGGMMNSGAGRFGYAPTGGPMAGARYALELSGPLSFGGVVGYIKGERDVVDPGRAEGDRVIGQADASIVTIDARLRFTFTGRRTWHRLAPYFTAGGGIALDAASESPLDRILLPADRFNFGTSFFGTLGLGTRWFVTDRIVIRPEWIFSLWKIGTPPGYADPDRGFLGVSDGEWLWGNQLTVGLLYRW